MIEYNFTKNKCFELTNQPAWFSWEAFQPSPALGWFWRDCFSWTPSQKELISGKPRQGVLGQPTRKGPTTNLVGQIITSSISIDLMQFLLSPPFLQSFISSRFSLPLTRTKLSVFTNYHPLQMKAKYSLGPKVKWKGLLGGVQWSVLFFRRFFGISKQILAEILS